MTQKAAEERNLLFSEDGYRAQCIIVIGLLQVIQIPALDLRPLESVPNKLLEV